MSCDLRLEICNEILYCSGDALMVYSYVLQVKMNETTEELVCEDDSFRYIPVVYTNCICNGCLLLS